MTPNAPAPLGDVAEPSPGGVGAADAPVSVTERAARGLLWVTVASVVAKVVGFGQLIALAYFLGVEDFGLLTMAATAVSFASVPLRFGLEEILIQRQRRFHLWAGPAFWMSIAAGVGTVLLLCAAAPLAAWFYGNWRVAAIVLTMALAIPITAATAVPTAYLSARMRFRTTALVGVLQILVQAGVALPLAAMGAGAMSVATASVASAAAVAAYAWTRPGVPRPGRPRVRRWRHFLRDTGMIQGSRLATAVASNVDFIVVGRLAGAGPLGVYSYAYNQSLQAMRLIGTNAAAVLFPSLTSLGDDPGRKYDAFCRGLRLVLPLMVPFCLLQAALADPGFRLLFKPEYWPGIPLFQILSVGTIGACAVQLCYSLILSLRRNDLVLANAAGSAGLFCVLVPPAYALGGVPGVAIAVAATGGLSLALAHWLSARAAARPVGPALRLYAMPLLLGALTAAVPWGVVTLALPADRHGPAIRLAAGLLSFAAVFPPALWLTSRATFVELVGRLRPLWSRRRT